jgi:putrescine transport system substrate-binding protein
MRLRIKALSVMLGSIIAVTAQGADAVNKTERVLNFYNWSDYVAEDTLEKFTAQSGITVNLVEFDEEDEVNMLLDEGSSEYDLVVTSLDYMAQRLLMQKSVFQNLNQDKLVNTDNLNAEAMAFVGQKDPFNNYGIPYLWGTVGIGYDVNAVEKAFNGNAPTNSWDLLLDPKNLQKLQHCGVAFVDSPSEVLPIIINYLGGDPNTMDKGIYFGMAQKHLQKLAPYVTFTSDISDGMSEGEYCAVLGWSGDVLYAADLAEENETGVELAYSIPREGTSAWYDMLVIPKHAQNVDAAYEFLNFLMQPEIIADVTNYVWYPNVNSASNEYIEEDILSDENIYPTPAIQRKLYLLSVAPKRLAKHQQTIWDNAKAQ